MDLLITHRLPRIYPRETLLTLPHESGHASVCRFARKLETSDELLELDPHAEARAADFRNAINS